MVWLSIGLGAGIGLLYAVASYANALFAARQRTQTRFMVSYFGGMVLRMAVALLLMSLVLVQVPVHLPFFVATFLAAFSIGLVTEVAVIHREATARRRDD